MLVLDDKYTIVQEETSEGFLRPYLVQTAEGVKGRLYWFEVHSPGARTAFHRYKNAIRRLEGAGLLPQGVQTSANPGRYYVFWPEQPKAAKPKKLKAILEALEPFGYKQEDLELTEESGRTLVALLKPQIATPSEKPVEENVFTPEPAKAPTPLPEPLTMTGQTGKEKPAKPARPAKPKAPPRQYRWNWPGWVPGLLMLAVGSWGIWQTSMRYLNPPEYVLPDMVGKTPTQAYEAVRTFGLKVVFSEGSDPSLPKDQVLEQTPDPGTRVKPGRRLELVINKPRFGSVPTVSGRSLEDARQALESAGYTLKGITRIASGDTKDTVLASIPKEGSPLRQGDSVRLLVSTGTRPAPRETLLPDLTGLSEDDARYILTIAELVPVVVKVASGAPDGTVIGQSPGPGVVLSREAQVRLQVATQTVASVPKSSPFQPPRLAPPPPPEPTPPEPTPEPNPTLPGTPEPGTPTPTPEPTTPEAGTPTPTPTPEPQPQGPQERRVNVSFTLPQAGVVTITVQDETGITTVVEGPQEAGWSINQEIIVRGTATLRILVDGQVVQEGPI